MKIPVIALVVLSLLSIGSTRGIADSTDSTVDDSKILPQIDRGTAVLDCVTSSCAAAWAEIEPKAKTASSSMDWWDVGPGIVRADYDEDLTWYYLGRAAEGIGSASAARIYYSKAVAAASDPRTQCAQLGPDQCDGFEFPKDANARLAAIAGVPDPSDEPTPIDPPPLYYPRAAYAARIEGSVRVGFMMNNGGGAIWPRVTESTPPGVFDRAAIENVSLWRFDQNNITFRQMEREVEGGYVATLRFELKNAVLRPIPKEPLLPLFPQVATNTNGDCMVDFWIEPDGSVSNATISYCFPEGIFEQASLAAIRSATFNREADPVVNRRRHDTYLFRFRTGGDDDAVLNYLQPEEWVKLSYTLTVTGHAENAKVVDESGPGLDTASAISQLESTTFPPCLVNGVPTEKPGQIMVINGPPSLIR